MQGEIFKMKSDRFFTRPACVYVHSLLPRVLPVGWESCQRGKLEVVISRGSEFEGEEGKNRGRSQNRSNRQEDRALAFLDRWPGKKPRPPAGGALGPWKEQTWKKKQDGWEWRRVLGDKAPSILPWPQAMWLFLGLQRTITLCSVLPSRHSLSHLSSFHFTSLQTCRSTQHRAAAFQTFLESTNFFF